MNEMAYSPFGFHGLGRFFNHFKEEEDDKDCEEYSDLFLLYSRHTTFFTQKHYYLKSNH